MIKLIFAKINDMYRIAFFFSIFICLLSCSTFKSGLTIPANQTFLLGELNDENYTATLVNRSGFTVLVQAIDKHTGNITQGFGLAPKGKTKLYVSKDETVYFTNENNDDVRVDLVLSKAVEGMRYIENQWYVSNFLIL